MIFSSQFNSIITVDTMGDKSESNNIRLRATRILNLQQYDHQNKEEFVTYIDDLQAPNARQYVLRMLISRPFLGFRVPDEYMWTYPLIEKAYEYQIQNGIRQPFCYLTIRHGLVDSQNDATWHVDGFSMNVTHIPEQNYIWVNKSPTQVIHKSLPFPADFNPFIHNIHSYIQDSIDESDPKTAESIVTLKENSLYVLDPYIIHRRPPNTDNMQRTLVRISFTPIEIEDCNNTPNPLIPTNYMRDGVKAFRDTLIRYIPAK